MSSIRVQDDGGHTVARQLRRTRSSPIYIPPSNTTGSVGRYLSPDGDLLPMAGVIVDNSANFAFLNQAERRVFVDGSLIVVREGVLGGELHLIVATRSETDQSPTLQIRALVSAGITQIFSASRAEVDTARYVEAMSKSSDDALQDIHLGDPTDLISAVVTSICPRLGPALIHSSLASGFEILPEKIRAALSSPSLDEAAAARDLGVCYAALDVLPIGVTDAAITAATTDALSHVVEAISVLSSCNCHKPARNQPR